MGLATLAGVTATCEIDKLVSSQVGGVAIVSPAELTDSAAVGSAAPRAWSVEVTHNGSGTLSWAVTRASASEWIVLAGENGTAPGEIGVTLSPEGLPAGTYHDTLVVRPGGGTIDPTRLPIRFTIHSCLITPAEPDGRIADSLTTADCTGPRGAGRFAKLFEFSAAGGDSVTVTLETAGYAGHLAVDGAAGGGPAMADDAACRGVPGNPCLPYVLLPVDGDYIVAVSTEVPGATGSFELRITPPAPPTAPATLRQRGRDSVGTIEVGSAVPDTGLVLRGALADPDFADLVRLEVEVRRVGVAFTGVPTDSGDLVAVGSNGHVLVDGLADDDAYHWQARARDMTGRASGWVNFGANGEEDADFHIATPEDPGVPVDLGQFRIDGETPIVPGDSIEERSVVFRARLTDPDPDDVLQLEVEVRPVGEAFTGSPTGLSVGTLEGDTATVTVSGLADHTDYRWRARTADQSGRRSPWVPFGPAGDPERDFRVAVPQGPDAPSTLVQLRGDTATPIDVGETVPEADVVLGGTVSDPNAGDQLRLQVELRPVGVAFTNVATGFSPVVGNGEQALVRLDGLTDDRDYHWQARVTDQTGQVGPWTPFGGNAESAADVGIAVPAVSVAFGVQPRDVAVDTPIAPAVTVEAREADGTIDSAYDGTVSVVLSSGAGTAGATLSGTASVAAVAGVATFDDLRIDLVGTDYQLDPSATGLTGATSDPFTVSSGTGAALRFDVQPTDADVAAAITPPIEVAVLDGAGNVATDFTGAVSLSLTPGSGTAGAALHGTTSVTPVDGVARFPGLRVDRVGTGYTIDAAAPGLPTATSAPFDITPGPATRLSFLVHPSDVVAGVSVAPAVQVAARDVVGTLAIDFDGDVTVALTAGTGTSGAALSGMLTVAAVDGVATFESLAVDSAGTAYTLTVTTPGLSALASEVFDVTPGPAATIEFAVQPGDTPAGEAIAPAVEVLARDAEGNVAGGFTGAVTMAIASGTGATGADLSGTTVVSAVDGVATFADLSIDLAATGYELEASAAGLTAVRSAAFEVFADSATTLAIEDGDGQAADVGTTVSIAPVVLVTDEFGNPVSGVAVTFTASGDGVVIGGGPATSDGDGLAAVTSWTLGTTAGTESDTLTAVIADVDTVRFVATATPGPADAAETTADVPAGAEDEETEITITIRDAEGNVRTGGGDADLLRVRVSGANRERDVPVTDNGDGTYTATYTPEDDGEDTITITLDRTDISGSPFTSTVSDE